MKFVSIDSSLNNTGIAVGTLLNEDISIEKIFLFENGEDIEKKHKDEKKRNRKKTKECIEKCELTYSNIRNTLQQIGPSSIDIIFIEEPTGSQNSSGMKSYGATCNLIGVLKGYFKVETVNADEAKIASVGNKKATKREIIDWSHKLHPNLEWETHRTGKSKGQLKDKNEHMADAIAIGYAGIKNITRS